jgi:nucleoside-diphosphate-sugar epimerase/acyl carrier protein
VTTSVVATLTALQRRLAGVCRNAWISPDLVLPEESLAALGMDSLAAVELTAAIEDEMGIELPLTAVHDFPTLETLCGLHRTRRDVLGDTRSSRDDRGRRSSRITSRRTSRVSPRRGSREMREAVLLTGATGFVGAHLVRALAAETDADIHCLVRAQRRRHARAVAQHLARYGVWSEALESRLHVVQGDLTLPRLGLSTHAFEQLASGVDAIYHAAEVNWVASYSALRPANVLGTVEVLRLACTGVPKPVHFLSSVSVCHSTSAPRRVDEDLDALTSIDGLWMGYAQSKCVAEALVRTAGERGLTVTIIRPSLITGDRVTGRSNPDDLISRFVAGASVACEPRPISIGE